MGSETTAFIPKHNYANFAEKNGTVTHIDFGGDELVMPVGSKDMLFEMHHYFGPMPLNKRTGEGLANIPNAFWDAFERWKVGGMLVNETRCVVPQWCQLCKGSGDEVRHIGGRHWEMVGTCKRCNGRKVEAT